MNTCQLIHLIVFFLLGLKWLDLLLPVKAYFELTEVFLKEKKNRETVLDRIPIVRPPWTSEGWTAFGYFLRSSAVK